MISEIVVDNFKVFGSRQHIPLAPLTLIFGGNSAGKSTVIQALLALRQSFVRSDPVHPIPTHLGRQAELVVRGGLVDLGSFDALIHGHDKSRKLTLGITATRIRGPFHSVAPQDELGIEWTFQRREPNEPIRHLMSKILLNNESINFTAPKIQDTRMPNEHTIDLSTKDTRTLLRWASSRDHSPAIANSIFGVDALRARIRLSSGIPIGCIGFNIQGQTQGEEEDVDEFSESISDSESITHMSKVEREASASLDRWLRMGPVSIRRELADVEYLGPLRTPPERFNVLTGERVRSTGISGEKVVDVLARTPRLLEDVNDWLQRLEIPYSADIRAVSDEAVSGAIGEVHCLLLRDRRTNTEVAPTDVGFGIGQVLPVVVQTLLNNHGVLCVEQPEIHLHPALQARLAEMFAHVIIDSPTRAQFILETHSEHLILRLQRLIRRGVLSHELVSVLHVGYSAEGTAEVHRLRLDKHGEFQDEWPGGFFDNRFEELFGD